MLKPKIPLYSFILAGFLCSAGCEQNKTKTEMTQTNHIAAPVATASDSHSFAKPKEAVATHLNLDIAVNFEAKTISGRATYTIQNLNGGNQIIFDTRDLTIEKVYLDGQQTETEFKLGDEKPFLGKPLYVTIKPETRSLSIQYRTSPSAAALQWLSPQQTAGKKYPFLFTQSQAILARTWIPIQDSPGIRITYEAKVKVPTTHLALMSAENPQQKNDSGVYNFRMKQPIPSYLMALAVGDLTFEPIGTITGVYSEPATIKEASYEFAELDKMIAAAEKLYGKYRWERYDLLVLPPSFPFGGMENPRLTFVTPTILAKDRSLTSLVAHELAHSWSGNLVTNATWNDFWLNEGFTVYFERRIMESIYGKDYADMLDVLGQQDLHHTLEELGPDSPDTQLKLSLEGRDPDDGMNDIAYEKGNLFLLTIEEAVGREKFDAFVNNYFATHAFKSVDTDIFLNFLDKELIKSDKTLQEKLRINDWIFKPGIPDNAPKTSSVRFAEVDKQNQNWIKGTPATELKTQNWSSHEWLHFIRHLPEKMTPEQMTGLDKAFNFTNSGNSEILAAWFVHTIRNNYKPADAALEAFLVKVGRRKFLLPLYKGLLATPEGQKKAEAIYQKARPNYHAVAVVTIDDLIHKKEEAKK